MKLRLLLLMSLIFTFAGRVSAALFNGDVNITVNGEERVYKCYVPDSWATTADPVLIFSNHGANNSRNFGRPEFNAVADKYGCVIVYTQGLTQDFYLAGMSGAGWAATGELNTDVDYIKAIIEDQANTFKQQGKTLNRKRIYCCGFSNGGMFTYALSNVCSDIFAAFASISGFQCNEYHLRHYGARPVPFLHIHGGADDFVNVEWYPTILDNMVARNGCNPVPKDTNGSAKTTDGTETTYKKRVYEAANGGFPYVYINVAAMGHNDTCYIDGKHSSEVMYEFLTQYTLDDQCDNTLLWSGNLDTDGFTPQYHGWWVSDDKKTFSYGTTRASSNSTDHNVYRDLQMQKGAHQVRINSTGDGSRKIGVKLETMSGKVIFNKSVNVGQKSYITFTTSEDDYKQPQYDKEERPKSYGEYKITITKENADDKITALLINKTHNAWEGATEITTDEAETPTEPEVTTGDTDLTTSIFHEWNGTGADATIKTESVNCDYTLNTSTGCAYGHSNIVPTDYADISAYSKLEITTSAGSPRVFLNCVGNNDAAMFPNQKPFATIKDNGNGTTTYTVNIESVVKEAGYAHLNAIKGADWQTNVTVKSIRLITKDNCFMVSTPGLQTNPWDRQIRYKMPKAMVTGKQYTVEMKTKAALNGSIQIVAVDNDSENKDQWGGSADIQYLSTNVTPEWTTTTVETNGTYPYDYLFFNIGKVDGDLLITNIKVTEKGTSNVLFEDGMNDITPWTKTQNDLNISIESVVNVENNLTKGRFVFTGYDNNPDYTLRPIRQLGKDLVYVDAPEEKVVLHGVMATPNSYFNESLWDFKDWSTRYETAEDRESCKAYFSKVLTLLTDNKNGAYCDVLRFQLDPAWILKSGGDVNDFTTYDLDKFKLRLDDVYWPIIQEAMAKGLYVIVRPPGVCPHDIQVGDAYQQYLIDAWDIVSKDERFKRFAGQISIELANEPIDVSDAAGNKNSAVSLHDFFQPMVDKIRENGFKGIIWSAGRGYQSDYTGYAEHPIKGDNIGYAVHFYPGWFGTDTKEGLVPETAAKNFRAKVPVVDTNPIVITEVDWSPEVEPRVFKDINEQGQVRYQNYGTWATGTTSGFGKAFRGVHDIFGNISFTIEGEYLVYDVAQYLKDGTVTYAFSHIPQPEEACGYTSYHWYREWAKNHWINGNKPADTGMFSLEESAVNPSIYETGTYSYDKYKYTGTLKVGQYGFGGWRSSEGFDVSKYSSMTIHFDEAPTTGSFDFRIFDTNNYWSEPVSKTSCTNKKSIEVSFAGLDKIYIAGFWGNGSGSIKIRQIDLNSKLSHDNNFSFDNFKTEGTATFDKEEHKLSGGTGGWTFDTPLDLNTYHYLIITSAQNRSNCKSSAKVLVSAHQSGDYSWPEIYPEVGGDNLFKEWSYKDNKTVYTYGVNQKKLWLDQWNNQNVMVISLDSLNKGGLEKKKFKSLKFNIGNDDLYLNNVYLSKTFPTYDGDYKRASAANKWGTICLPYRAAYAGCTIYEVTAKGNDKIYMKRVEGFMEPGRSYFYHTTPNYEGNADHYVRFFKVENDEATVPANRNGMIGTFADTTAPKSTDNESYYVMSNNKLYFVDSDVKVGANKAYVNMKHVPALQSTTSYAKAISFTGGFNDASDVAMQPAEVMTDAVPVAFYNAAGQKMDTMQKGINIVRMSDGTTKTIILK